MFDTRKLKLAAWVGVSVSLAPVAAYAQGGGDRTMRCSADTRNGVRMVRQMGNARCIEGYTWGYNEQGVWVDRGCQAEFVLPGNGGRGNWERFTRIEPGTIIPVRVDSTIDSDRADGRIYTGVVDQDVRGSNGRLAIP